MGRFIRRTPGFVACLAVSFVVSLGLAACSKDAESKLPSGPQAPPAPPAPTPVPPPTPRAVGPNAPVLDARTVPEPASGQAPFDVNFNACKTVDPDGDPLTYTYTFGDGQVKTQSLCRHHHVYASGSYTATVCVTDGLNSVCRTFGVRAF